MRYRKNPGPMLLWGLFGVAGLGFVVRKVGRPSRVRRSEPTNVTVLWPRDSSVIERNDRRWKTWVLVRALPKARQRAEKLVRMLSASLPVPVATLSTYEGADSPCFDEYAFTPLVEIEVRQDGHTASWTCIPDDFFLDPDFFPRVVKTVRSKIEE